MLTRGNSASLPGAGNDSPEIIDEMLSLSGYYFDFSCLRSMPSQSKGGDLKVPHIHVCFNLAGEGSFLNGTTEERFSGQCYWYVTRGETALEITRKKGQQHRFLCLLLSKQWLRDDLLNLDSALHSVAQRYLKQEHNESLFGSIRPISSGIRHWLDGLNKPPVPKAARPLWYRAKALEVACELFFDTPQDELFCHRHQRIAESRTTQVKKILESRLEEPPSLKELGRIVGCSPYYLSRTFSKQAGMTIPQFLRQRRLEKAAELLREGNLNVTEVALEVGYSSMSHFSQAFCQTMGCCPAMYPLEKRS